MKLSNPLAFTPLPTTIVTAAVYIVIVASLLVVHHALPSAEAVEGTDLEVAWQDLQTITTGFHPFNSHKNDAVREWLLARLDSIAQTNAKPAVHVQDAGLLQTVGEAKTSAASPAPITVFSDIVSNVSNAINTTSHRPGYSMYFEGTNIMVYVQGSDDDPLDWWLYPRKPPGEGGVLVNAHYDSVSTGYGATDDGSGIVTILQLLTYFTTPGKQPRKGIVALFNNGEEDFLNGARAFAQHPLSKFPRTFLNLEGAGAGGKATLFRSSTAEVTKSYQRSRHPFGSVVSADGFRRGLIQSGTDYSVFEKIGLQGLDVAFFEPRSRYHTNQDDTKHTSKASLSHMLLAALSTMQDLTDSPTQGGKDSVGIWFDLFNSVFVVFKLQTLFALSVTLIVVSSATLSTIGAFLYRSDRNYILSGSSKPRTLDNAEPISIKGRRGILRWPITFVVASAVIIGLSLLLVKVNPLIIYSSPYAVWSLMISAWLAIAWLCVSTADYYRPTAFQRLYTLMWMGLAAWIVNVAATILEKKQQIAGGYLMFFYHASIFLAAVIALLELFGLPTKTAYTSDLQIQGPAQTGGLPESGSMASGQLLSPSNDEARSQRESAIDDDEDADERTSLIHDAEYQRTTFKRYSSPHQREEAEEHERAEKPRRKKVYGLEQPWSHALPSYLWLLEFIFIAPFPLIILGQVSLLLTSALSQTLADGSSPLVVYLFISVLTILLVSPLGPFLHRYTYHIPLFLTLVAVGTLIYNLTAFPFSATSRLKLRFVQRLDLETGANNVTLTGISHGFYLRSAISALPSSFNQSLTCVSGPQTNLQECSYSGILPRPISPINPYTDQLPPFHKWLTFNITTTPNNYSRTLNTRSRTTQSKGKHTAHFSISGLNTRACKLVFDTPITNFTIEGAGPDDSRFPKIADGGSRELRLWSRTWDREWKGTFTWKEGNKNEEGEEGIKKEKGPLQLTEQKWKKELRKRALNGKRSGKGMSGQAVCLWSDANVPGTIPALDELWKYAPEWVAVTKAQDGLVEGWKAWSL